MLLCYLLPTGRTLNISICVYKHPMSKNLTTHGHPANRSGSYGIPCWRTEKSFPTLQSVEISWLETYRLPARYGLGLASRYGRVWMSRYSTTIPLRLAAMYLVSGTGVINLCYVASSICPSLAHFDTKPQMVTTSSSPLAFGSNVRRG